MPRIGAERHQAVVVELLQVVAPPSRGWPARAYLRLLRQISPRAVNKASPPIVTTWLQIA